MLQGFCRAGIDCITDSGSKTDAYKDIIASLFALIIAVVIVAFIGKWLWNNSMVELFTFARPVKTVWHIIALMLFLTLMK